MLATRINIDLWDFYGDFIFMWLNDDINIGFNSLISGLELERSALIAQTVSKRR